ncbi:TetR/AcrR family transcriptional regulator [Anaerosporobacter sp.]|uniref:TetR/AcrR family transcriptional regulator n=1 Tax=Anaerosporobacter sp. TaxID=1872529 RepID=UPI00286F0008|nr:TetR/AcrR family transcriptional regulator [Anaerosporobacter sp.]
MTSRSEQKEQRRQLIIAKALELFVTKGFRETKINDIAKAANMSTGLLFHYFESKEQLYEELVRIGIEGTKAPSKLEYDNPYSYFANFLTMLFEYSKAQPWVMQMFVLMFQARRGEGVPEHIRELSMQTDQIEQSIALIKQGQVEGRFREGNPEALAYAFWGSVQGIMELSAVTPNMPLPNTQWLLDILTGGDR